MKTNYHQDGIRNDKSFERPSFEKPIEMCVKGQRLLITAVIMNSTLKIVFPISAEEHLLDKYFVVHCVLNRPYYSG